METGLPAWPHPTYAPSHPQKEQWLLRAFVRFTVTGIARKLHPRSHGAACLAGKPRRASRRRSTGYSFVKAIIARRTIQRQPLGCWACFIWSIILSKKAAECGLFDRLRAAFLNKKAAFSFWLYSFGCVFSMASFRVRQPSTAHFTRAGICAISRRADASSRLSISCSVA